MNMISPAAYNRPNFYQTTPEELNGPGGPVANPAVTDAQSRYRSGLAEQLLGYKAKIQSSLSWAGSPVVLQARLSQILSQLQPEVRTVISQAPGGAEGLAAAAKQVGQFFFDMSQGLENPTQLETFFTALYQQLDGIPGVLREVERQRNRALSRKIADQKASEKNKALALPQQASPAPRPISATDYPSPHQTARTRAIQILKEQYELSDVDPDKVTVQFVETKALHLLLGMPTPLGMQAALDPQQQSASRRFPSMSLTDALIKHFEQNKLGTFESIHDADHPGLGAANVRMFYEDSAKIRQHLDPKKAAAAVSATDLKASYLAAVEQFWTAHQEALNAQQTQLMRKAIAYQTARNTLSELSANFLTQQLDQRTSSAQLLSMDGYPSTDLLVFRLSDSDRVILYIPAELQAFHEFKDDDQLKNWVMARLVLENHNNTSGAPGNPEDLREARRILATISGFFSKKTDTSEEWVGDSHGFSSSTKLLTHFKGENRIAGLDYFVKSIGMEIVNSGSRMPQLRRSDKSLRERAGYFKAGVTFDAVPSTQSQLPIGKLLAIRQKEHHTEEAYQIVSNSDVYRHRATEWLNYLEQLAMLALIPVAPELSLPALAGISASKLGLSAADLYYAHDEEERSQAVLGIAAESSNLLQLAIAAGAGKIIGSVSGDSKTVEASLSDASKIDEIRPEELPHPDTAPKPRESAVKPTPRVEEATPPRLAQELNGLSAESVSLVGKLPQENSTYSVDGHLYIAVENKVFRVRGDNGRWRVISSVKPTSEGVPVRFEQGKWISDYEGRGLPGGGPCLSRPCPSSGSVSGSWPEFKPGDLVYGLAQERAAFVEHRLGPEAANLICMIDHYNNLVTSSIYNKTKWPASLPRNIEELKKYSQYRDVLALLEDSALESASTGEYTIGDLVVFDEILNDKILARALAQVDFKDVELELSNMASTGKYPLLNEYIAACKQNPEKFGLKNIYAETFEHFDSDEYHKVFKDITSSGPRAGLKLTDIYSEVGSLLQGKRGSKTGIEMMAMGGESGINQNKIHFVLDGLNESEVISKGEPYGKSITSSELRYIYRNRERLKNRVLFYKDDKIVEAPWVTHPEAWQRGYLPSERTMRL